MPRKMDPLLDSFGTLAPYAPTLRERLAEALRASFGEEKAQDLGILWDNSPLSVSTEMDIAGRMAANGNFKGAALTAALALVPGRKVVKEAAEKAVKTAEKLGEFFDYSRLGELPKQPQHGLLRYVPPRGVPRRIIDLRTDPGQ